MLRCRLGGRFTLIFGYEVRSILKTLLWLWNVEESALLYFNLCLVCEQLYNLSCSFTSTFTNQLMVTCFRGIHLCFIVCFCTWEITFEYCFFLLLFAVLLDDIVRDCCLASIEQFMARISSFSMIAISVCVLYQMTWNDFFCCYHIIAKVRK